MPNADTTSLDELQPGSSATVQRIDLSPGEGQRLMEMGLTPGTRITVLKLAPLGDPIEIAVRGGHLTLRGITARRIFVVPITTPAARGRSGAGSS
jgi:Fe2+ transport system protein FeoA